MNEDTASNGITIRIKEDGYLTGNLDGLHATAGPLGIAALRELFRAEEDERLGRWRYLEMPWLVVYHWGQPVTAGVVVFDEGSGTTSRVIHRGADPENQSPEYLAARAYFDAHPEPQPWHDAKPGEVWVLTCDDDALGGAYVAGDHTFIAADHAVEIDSSRIKAGRRIWPEMNCDSNGSSIE